MNQRIVHIVFGVIALCLVLSAAALAETATGSGPPLDPRAMKFDPVTFTTPKVERVVLENGMIVYLLPDAELPLASITAMIRTGAVYEPKDKVGLTGIVSTVMRTGGTARMTGDQIDEELEFLAASVSVVIGAENELAG